MNRAKKLLLCVADAHGRWHLGLRSRNDVAVLASKHGTVDLRSNGKPNAQVCRVSAHPPDTANQILAS